MRPILARVAARCCIAVAIAIAAGACGGAQHAEPSAADAAFGPLRDRLYDELLAFHPSRAVGLGLHAHDGEVGDRAPATLAARAARLHAAEAELDAAAPGLSAGARLERAVLGRAVRRELFELEALRLPYRSPLYYLFTLDVQDYISRDYAPLADRARAVARHARAAHAVLAQAQENLAGPIPRPWLEVALLVAGGQVAFVHDDVRAAVEKASEPARGEALAALAVYEQDLAAFRTFLAGKRASATDDFALGPGTFLRLLADQEGLVTDLPTLRRVAEEDTDRNLAALAQAAAAIAPGRPVADVVAQLTADVPPADGVVALAARQVDEARRFVIEHHLATVPDGDPVEVRVAPPFMRTNPAFLRARGPFETGRLPSFYYLATPDPTWPEEQRRRYLQPVTVLLFTSAHEVIPGHFLQHLHGDHHPSRVVKSFCSYAYTEGWAHYVEEMLWDEGFGAGDPRVRAGMLLSALMRDVRLLASLGLHTGGMTVDQAAQLFVEKGFMAPGPARQQALRGTLDPGYGLYTLGKLMIRKLARDHHARTGASLAAFHDAFLDAGCAAIPTVREILLGPDAGPAL